MNDQRFFDLAMKLIARQATDAEQAELDDLLAREPKLRGDLARLQADVRLSKEALAVVAATETTSTELPGYARERLQTKVRQTLGRPQKENKDDQNLAMMRKWSWLLGLAAAAAVILFVALPLFRATKNPMIEVAMLDTTGGTRGTDTNDIALLEAAAKGSPLRTFSNASEAKNWEQSPTADGHHPVVKIIYDKAAAEVRVSIRSKGEALEKTFSVEKTLGDTLAEVNNFLRQHYKADW
jgi:hypothetical protein